MERDFGKDTFSRIDSGMRLKGLHRAGCPKDVKGGRGRLFYYALISACCASAVLKCPFHSTSA